MNYVNTANSKYMKPIINLVVLLLLLCPLTLAAQQQPVWNLDSILLKIDKNNILLQSYAYKAEGYKYSADAATAWMAPMVGAGTFMTPYPGQMVMDDRDKGNLMLAIEQDIPNPAKLNAKKKFIASQGNIENANRAITLNELRTRAKKLYYNWLISEKRITVLKESQQIMEMMKKIEEVRYPYNQSQLGSVFQANAKIEDNSNMIRMQEGNIAKARSWINSLMNQPGNQLFVIDTTATPIFNVAPSYNTDTLALARKDIFKMNESIQSMRLNIESMTKEKKPDFRIRLDNMFPLAAGMPKSYSLMGMVSIPIVPWASRMYKSEIKSMNLNIQGMEKEKSAMLQETQGMLYGMQYEIESMQQRITGMEDKILPSLQKSLDAYFHNYEENKLALTTVITAWEAMNMMQMNILDEKLKLYEMIADYEKELYR